MINPAGRSLFASLATKFIHSHLAPNAPRLCRSVQLGETTGYNYKRSSNACNHDIRTCKHARYNAARTCTHWKGKRREPDNLFPAIWANVYINQREIVRRTVTMQWPTCCWSFYRFTIRPTICHSANTFVSEFFKSLSGPISPQAQIALRLPSKSILLLLEGKSLILLETLGDNGNKMDVKFEGKIKRRQFRSFQRVRSNDRTIKEIGWIKLY